MSAKRSDALLHKRENGYRSLSAEEKAAMNAYCEDYKTFLDKSRTEREAVRYTVQLAEARGYRPYHRGDALKPGIRSIGSTGIRPSCWRSWAPNPWTRA